MSTHRRRALNSSTGKEDGPNYLCFCANTANSSIAIELQDRSGDKITDSEYELPQLEYSRDKITWIPFVHNATAVNLDSSEDKIYLRGDNPEGLSISKLGSGVVAFTTFVMTGSISAKGSIQSLLDKNVLQNSVPANAFMYLFRNCFSLTCAPKLPALVLSNRCYSNMFARSSITKSPELPAKNLQPECYNQMFIECLLLTTVGKIHAESVDAGSCLGMFSFCSSLITLPRLYVTSISTYGLNSMFYGCRQISVRVAPDESHQNEFRIPYTGTASGAQPSNMFSDADSDLPNGTPDLNTTYYTSNELV